VESKNNLENYIYSIRHSMKDEKIRDKYTEDDKSKLEKLLDET
jgi:heat shock protein 1/8